MSESRFPTGLLGATELLGIMISSIPDPHEGGIWGDDFVALEHGMAATIITPKGEHYRVSVEWLGDGESNHS